MKRPLIAAIACGALISSTLLAAASASAHDRDRSGPITAGTPSTLVDSLLTPLSLDVDRRGVSYLSQDFAGKLTRVDRDGTATDIVTAPEGASIGAVSTRRGNVYYSQRVDSPVLMQLDRDGVSTPLADLGQYEADNNPDQDNTYGFVDLPEACAAQFPADAEGQSQPVYTGLIDSNPYASLALKDGVYVADAGANAILRVDYDGEVSTVAVLPPGDPVTVSADLVASQGFPECAAGLEYRFEPVPTDVEVGPDGRLYVTTLPGGPEDPSLGARGSVYKVNPWNGKVKLVATGFVGATDLAVSKNSGTIFVAELFGGEGATGQVSMVRSGSDTPTALIALSGPAAIELRRNTLYVTTDAFAVDPDTGAPKAEGKLTLVPLDRGPREDSDDEG